MLEKLNDKNLHIETIKAAKSEKAATIFLLKHLHEINRRKLFVDYGYSTLQKYIICELGYSEAESWTRIQAMRLVATTKLAEEKIESGELSLLNASLIQKQAKDEKLSLPKVENLIKESLGKSSSEIKEKMRPTNEKKIILNERILAKIKKLGWEQSELEVFEALLDEKLKEQETSKSTHTKEDEKVSRYIPVATKREVLKRSKHKCEYPGCTERRNLQYDHIKPYSLGGERGSKNIRLLCFAHNQRRSIKTFGQCFSSDRKSSKDRLHIARDVFSQSVEQKNPSYG